MRCYPNCRRSNIFMSQSCPCIMQVKILKYDFFLKYDISSAYFRTMFTANMLERDLEIIELKDISSDGLESVIKFIYTNKIRISTKNIHDILHSATLLQVDPVIGFCCQYLQEEIRYDFFF